MTTDMLIESEILEMFPEFKDRWGSEDNLFREDNGSFTLCGLFAEFSHFVRERLFDFNQDRKSTLFAKVETWIASDSSELNEAVATCFLENLTGEELSSELRPLLGPKSLEYFESWNRGKS